MTVVSLGGLVDSLKGWRRAVEALIAWLPSLSELIAWLGFLLRPIEIYRDLIRVPFGWVPDGAREIFLVYGFLLYPWLLPKRWTSKLRDFWSFLPRFVAVQVFVGLAVGLDEYLVGQDAVTLGLGFASVSPGVLFVGLAVCALTLSTGLFESPRWRFLTYPALVAGAFLLLVGAVLTVLMPVLITLDPLTHQSSGGSLENSSLIWSVSLAVGLLYFVLKARMRNLDSQAEPSSVRPQE